MTKTALRSWWTIVAGVGVGLAGAIVTLDRIPPRFEAIATIRADDLAQRLTGIRASLLADESMVELVRRTQGVSEHDEAFPGLIHKVRSRIRLAVDGPQRSGLDALELRYRDADAKRAAHTVNTLAELYLARHAGESEVGNSGQTAGRLEAAVVPTVSFSPDPMLVYGVFLALGWLLFSGPVVARGLLHPVISSEAGFVALSELPVLASIPAAATEEHRSTNRRRLLKNVSLSMLSCAILAGALVFARMG